MPGVVQIAGVRDETEARRIVTAGADWIGFPFRLEHHREDLSEAEARAIIRGLPGRVRPVLITYLGDAGEILALSRFLGVGAVQLHGAAAPELGAELKEQAPELLILRSLVVRPGNFEGLAQELREWLPYADGFLTDTFDPATGASGATGKAHDWEISRRLAELSPKPLILAGGLRPENVAAAILRVRPAGVDAHTGVEDAAGRKDPELLKRFVEEARAAFRRIGL